MSMVVTFADIMDIARSHGLKSCNPPAHNGLVGAWPMQEGGGTTAFDASGRGNDGTLMSMDPATDWVVGEYGRCLDFDGSNDYVNLGYSDVLNMSGTDFTATVWFCWSSFAANDNKGLVGSYGNSGTGNRSWVLATSNYGIADPRLQGALAFYFQSNSGSFSNAEWVDTSTASATYDDGVWHVANARFKSSTLAEIWVDGKFVTASNTKEAVVVPSSVADISDPIRIASYAAASYADIRLSSVLLHDRALAPSEIQQLYADPWAMWRRRPTQVFVSGAAPTFQAAWAAHATQVAS